MQDRHLHTHAHAHAHIHLRTLHTKTKTKATGSSKYKPKKKKESKPKSKPKQTKLIKQQKKDRKRACVWREKLRTTKKDWDRKKKKFNQSQQENRKS